MKRWIVSALQRPATRTMVRQWAAATKAVGTTWTGAAMHAGTSRRWKTQCAHAGHAALADFTFENLWPR
jgi:hypothetical protein